MAFLDEETIMQRILYKEKPDLKSLAQKCLELEKADYSKITSKERDEILSSLYEDLNSLDQITEKQAVLYEMHKTEMDYHTLRQNEVSNEIEVYTSDINELRKILDVEKDLRSNLLEYEACAKHINTLPKCSETHESIDSIINQLDAVNTKIREKQDLINHLETLSSQILNNMHAIKTLTSTILE